MPADLDSVGSPLNTLGVGGTVLVLSAVWDVEEEEFVGTTVGSDICAVARPVEGGDEGVVGLAVANLAEVVLAVIDSNAVVVRADSEHLLVWREGHGLNPFGRILDENLTSILLWG